MDPNPSSNGGRTSVGIYARMSNEVAITVPAPREDFISKAVSFLTNPNVVGHPQTEKESFLRSRGVTAEEIAAALDRCSSTSFQTSVQLPAAVSSARLLSAPPPTPFQKFRDILHTIALISGLSYGIYYFFKNVIIPFLFGRPKKPTAVESAVTELKTAVTESVVQLRGDVAKMATELERVVAVQMDQQATVRNLGDIKSEVATVKGILLSRQQFPSVPLTGSASIPAWQMAACADSGDRSSEVQNSNGGSQGSDSSLEMIKEADVAEADA